MRARTVSYFFSITAVAVIFFSIEFITEKYFYPNDEVVDILAAIIGALSFARCKRFFDVATDRIFSRAPRDERAEFITNISHELQTPIAILRGNVEVLQRKSTTEAERLVAERVIVNTLDSMSRLIGNVLESAKLRFFKNKKALSESLVGVGTLLWEVQEDCNLLVEEKDVRLLVDAEEFLYIRADRDRLKEVLLNLVSNALKHTPRGGSISLLASQAGSAARIVVADSGCGIAPEALPHIFERFYRIRSGGGNMLADNGSPSTGIGLNICKEIVEAHRGTITAVSERGKGSRFIIHLPLSPS